jgi:hypothetical protein
LRDYIIINPFLYFDKTKVHLLEANKFSLTDFKTENENDEISLIFLSVIGMSPKCPTSDSITAYIIPELIMP